MKNKPYPALLRPSNLSNEIGKRVPKSRETIPLKGYYHEIFDLWFFHQTIPPGPLFNGLKPFCICDDIRL
jgi:hypothetical protein